ncbi:sensor histidine kinase NtrY-like [Minwuia thermotolerans]|uniref:histidine kinase n=1 Tax=Minwuia thermotolerans TaxID=2056226 RepID=A0A2M9FYW0_9PROT|nr:PAS domain-containing sensor histidine kinase [Minwuia thermotolerans]PJK28651.1 two-component sensor histidine kinase [Minwuia thermotolerans]
MTEAAEKVDARRLGRLRAWILGLRPGRAGVFTLAALALIAGAATYAALFGSPEPPSSLRDIPAGVVVFDIVVLLLLVVAIVGRVARIWIAHRDGRAGAGLHMRLGALFAAAAVIPALLVAGFSTLFFDLRIEGWFSDRAQKAVSESVAVARSLIQEHRATIRADVLAMAQDLNRVAPEVQDDTALLTRLLITQAGARGLSEAIVFDRSGQVLAQTSLASDSLAEQIPISAIEAADDGAVVALPADEPVGGSIDLTANDKAGALVQLTGFLGTYRAYLYVARFVEPRVAEQVERAQQAATDYERLAAQRFSFELTFVLLFGVVTVLLMLAAVWLALNFSTRLSTRLGDIVGAAEKLREGDMQARVVTSDEDDEINMLGRTFNRMARQLESQQAALVQANRTLDERRRFMETVLSGVTAGVIGTDHNGVVDLPNRSALRLLSLKQDDLVGHPLESAVPEMADLLAAARERPHRLAEGEITIIRDGNAKTFFVRVGAERREREVLGYVVTFDDITDLVAAQRMAVWADVARRIAHEIRNPLTPIQLSAERLKRKYLKQIETDREIFLQCTDTIVRQVGDIGRMIDEFSAFARMPAPVMRPEPVADLVRQAVFAVEVANPSVEFRMDLEAGLPPLPCDRRQVAQVLTNVLLNAVQAIEARETCDELGVVEVKLSCNSDGVVITVTDNGIGLPVSERDRLTEPYMTTRDKGTGLGLAIVRKIMEDHSGSLHLGDRATGPGAAVTLVFPLADQGEERLRADGDSG